MRHLDVLDKNFGASHVLGGLCLTAATLNEKREVVQLGPVQSLGFGERDGKMSDRVRAIGEVVRGCNFDGATSETVLQDMWEKWVFLASNAASTSLMRVAIGMILAAPGGKDFLIGILDESRAVATAEGYKNMSERELIRSEAMAKGIWPRRLTPASTCCARRPRLLSRRSFGAALEAEALVPFPSPRWWTAARWPRC